MQRKENNTIDPQNHPLPLPDEPSANGELESIIKDGGYDNGRLFTSQSKATYTFLHDTEVISLHFDALKLALFLKGHKITNLEDHPHLGDFLTRFKRALLQHRSAKKFLVPFDTALSRLNTI